MRKSNLLISALLILFLVSTVSADIENLTSDVGTTWINWSWDYNGTENTSIYLNGEFVRNTTFNFYIVSDLNAREHHQLSLTNDSKNQTIIASNSVKTFYPPILFYLILTFSIIFLLFELLLKNEFLSLIIGILCFITSILGFYLSYPYYFSILSYLILGIAVIALLWCFMAAFSLISKEDEEELGI